MIQAHLFISGFVQGVGYRHFVRKNAQRFGLTGWVRNLPDNRVEAVLQGSKAQIEKLILLCRSKKGPFLAEIENIDIAWEEKKELFNDFEIVV
ncbi:MAG: acylphosphatase [Candidatus Levybacteria bacterium]|nr:acylphosphatase [Candidatus Levybacteria bacterium]